MRRAVVPLAILTAGCSFRPWTPSVSVAFWSEDVPDARSVALPSSAELARAWQLAPQSPWARYQKSTLIASVDPMGREASLPDVRQLEVVGLAERAAAHVAEVGMPPNSLWLLDLRGAVSCAFASKLTRTAQQPIAPVVTFNNWPALDAVVPAEETLAGLLAYPPRLPPPEMNALASATPLFLLDSWRLAYRFDRPEDDTFDNRYMLMPSDLPDATTLRERGIESVLYVVEDLDDAEVEEDDLNASFRAWQAAGIRIYLVDLDFLANVAPPSGGAYPAAWRARLAPVEHVVRERYTLVDDPAFYYRARGGFGLVYGRPFIAPGFRNPGYFGGGGYRGGGGSRGG